MDIGFPNYRDSFLNRFPVRHVESKMADAFDTTRCLAMPIRLFIDRDRRQKAFAKLFLAKLFAQSAVFAKSTQKKLEMSQKFWSRTCGSRIVNSQFVITNFV